MAKRDTRTRIIFQCDKAISSLDRVTEHLAKLDLIADQRSPYINDTLPTIVAAVDALEKILKLFREGL